jgi:hypothetical protein
MTEHSKPRRGRPLSGLLWAGFIFVLGAQIIRATVPSSAVDWAVTGVAGAGDVAVAGYLIHRVRFERRITRIYQASSSEDRQVLRWEITQAAADLARRGQLRGSFEERAASVRDELMSREKSLAGRLWSNADAVPKGEGSSSGKHPS